MALLALIAILVGLPAVSPASEGRTTSRPTLKIVSIHPVTVGGRGFKSGERVRVTADGQRKTVTAAARGSFKIVFPEANACNGFVAVARGSAGSRASVAFAQFSNVHCL